MAGYQKVIVCGRLGQDPELRQTTNGQPVCNLSLATSESWTDKDGKKQEKTEWHRCIIWGKQGEAASKYLTKGQECLVEGKLQTRQWEKDGAKMQSTEIVVERWTFVGSKKETATPATSPGFGDDEDVAF